MQQRDVDWMGKPAPNWPSAGAFAGTPAPDFPIFRPGQPCNAPSHLGRKPIERQHATTGSRGKASPRFTPAAPRAEFTRLIGIPLADGIRSRSATASSPHRAQSGDKAAQEGCERFSEPKPSRCRFCRPKRFLTPRRWILPLTHSESPFLVAVRRPPSGIEPPPAASVLGGGAGFRRAKRGGVCAGTNRTGDAQPVHGLVQRPDSAGFLHRLASL